ncbi:MAG: polyprenyl synthetase family protein [Mycobacteriaceae bacterium]|nr:polyprenyl synthetase family protein [Mycobacteriaceae bacterium]
MIPSIAYADHTPEDLPTSARGIWEPVARRAVEAMPKPLRLMAGYHLGWWDAAGAEYAAARGKAIRPAVVLAAAAACGGDESAAGVAAAAAELFHNFTLVHDDVMDADATRRGRPTVWRVWGVGNAILVGDALHAGATQLLAQTLPPASAAAAVARLADTAIELCRGQYEDCAFERVAAVGVDDYMRMAMGKTGTLVGCAAALGAVCAGADSATVAAMDAFGRRLGVAFQITDDILGIWGDPAVTGKPTGSDLARRKQSLPIVLALAAGTKQAAEFERWYRSTDLVSPAEIAAATTLLDTMNIRAATLEWARSFTRSATEALPDPAAAAGLLALADLAVHRTR